MRTLKLTIKKINGNDIVVSIPNAAEDSELTTAKLNAFVDAYDTVLGGNVLDSLSKAIVTSSTDSIIYPIN